MYFLSKEREMKRYQTIATSLFLLGAIFTHPASADSAFFSIETNSTRLTLEKKDEKVFLSNVESMKTEIPFSWIADATAVPLWTITIIDPNKQKITLTSLDGKASIFKIAEGQLMLDWSNIEPGKLRAQATITVRKNDFVWNLDFEVKEPGYTLWYVVYPEIGPLQNTEGVHAITPNGWGLLQKIANWRNSATYPSASRAMPFIAVSNGKTGLYLGVHDHAGHPIDLFAGGRPNEKSASFGIHHDVENAGKTVHYRLPYEVIATPFDGDWYECARIYREAAKQTMWGNIPSLLERKDIPQWFLDTDLWFCGACEDEKTADQLIAFAKYFEVPTSAHIYQWHEIPFDDHYPEYFPAKPGFKAAVEKVQKAGIAVMPYINGRLWDSATDSWKKENAEASCARDEKGEKYVEVYGSKVPLSPMCPFTELWKSIVTRLVDRLLNECGVKAVYIDQISAAAAKRCYAENHGHPVGGGTYWIQGYRDLLQRCRRVQPPNTALTTEENADPWNDQLQGWLLVNTPKAAGEIVPLYPAVYGGRAISFGFQYIQGNDFSEKYPFRLKMAQAFVFGSQLGWVGSQVLDASNTQEAEFLKALCQARHSSRDALQFGELLPPVAIEGGGTVSWTDDGAQQSHLAVLATAWLTPANLRKIAVANVADEERSITIKLDSRHTGLENGAVIHLQSEDRSITIPLSETESGFQSTIKLPARSARVYTIQKDN